MIKDNIEFEQETDLEYGKLISAIKNRFAWILGAVVVSSGIAAYTSLQKEPTYISSMQLLVEPNYQEQAGAARANTEVSMLIQNAPFEIDYATQIRIMRGSELLDRAVSLLEGEYPDIEIDNLRDRLSVVRATTQETVDARDETETSILEVTFTSNDPIKSQRVVEVLQGIYLDYNLEQQELRLQNGLAFINQQLPIVSNDVFQAEQSLENFRQTTNLIDPEARATELAGSLVRIEQERREVQAEFEDLRARSEILESQLKRTPQGALTSSRLSESGRYQSLLDSYQETELAIAEQRAQFTEESAYIRRLQEQRKNQERLLFQEVERVLGSTAIAPEQLFLEGQFGETDLNIVRELAQLRAALSGLVARDQGLANSEQQIREELSQYPELIAQFTRLQPEIEIKRDTLQQLLRARQEISIDIARGGLNWQIIETPQFGIRTGPNLVIDILLGSIAGIFIGTFLAIVREFSVTRSEDSSQVSEYSESFEKEGI